MHTMNETLLYKELRVVKCFHCVLKFGKDIDGSENINSLHLSEIFIIDEFESLIIYIINNINRWKLQLILII